MSSDMLMVNGSDTTQTVVKEEALCRITYTSKPWASIAWWPMPGVDTYNDDATSALQQLDWFIYSRPMYL